MTAKKTKAQKMTIRFRRGPALGGTWPSIGVNFILMRRPDGSWCFAFRGACEVFYYERSGLTVNDQDVEYWIPVSELDAAAVRQNL